MAEYGESVVLKALRLMRERDIYLEAQSNHKWMEWSTYQEVQKWKKQRSDEV